MSSTFFLNEETTSVSADTPLHRTGPVQILHNLVENEDTTSANANSTSDNTIPDKKNN